MLFMGDVIVIGGANVDIKAKSLEPNRLGTSNPGVVSFTVGGVGRNIAHNLAVLGASVGLISVVGNDSHGRMLLDLSRAAGIDISRVATADVTSGTYLALLDNNGELVTALSDMRATSFITPEIVKAYQGDLEAARFVVADCNLDLATLQSIAAIAGDKLVVEPVSVPKSKKLVALLQSSQVFLSTPNFDQIDALAGTRDIGEAFAFLHGLGLKNAVIHAGENGAFLSDAGEIDHVEAKTAGDIVDVTGAGDASVAGIVSGLLQGRSLAESVAIGQEMAGQVIASPASTLG
jgi:pseudouridine kinase